MTKPFKLEWVITSADAGKLIKQFVKQYSISKTALTDIKYSGGDILVNGEHVNVLHMLKEGEHLQILFPKEEVSHTLIREDIPLELVYEDEYLLVVNKPAYMNTIPSREHPSGSLANALMGYYKKIGIESSPHIVTRLDRNTSGLVLIAKHRYIHHLFSLDQQNNQIHRTYEAFVHGFIQEKKGTIKAPIARKKDSIIERTVDQNGQYAVTHYEVVQYYSDFTHIRLKLETGRTHQIRVHMSYIGHPLLGDDLYGGFGYIDRQALHCKELIFTHPIHKKEFHFHTSLPDDLLSIIMIEGTKN